MPRKSKTATPMIELIDELNNAEETIAAAVSDEEPKVSKVKPTSEILESKRAELLKLAESKDISKTPAYISKASAKIIEKVYAEVEASRIEKANVFLTDQLISKFAAVLGGFDAIEKPEELEKELKSDPLLRADVEKAMAMITPWIPLIGILSGGVTVGKHVYDHKGKKVGGEPPVSERTAEETVN